MKLSDELNKIETMSYYFKTYIKKQLFKIKMFNINKKLKFMKKMTLTEALTLFKIPQNEVINFMRKEKLYVSTSGGNHSYIMGTSVKVSDGNTYIESVNGPYSYRLYGLMKPSGSIGSNINTDDIQLIPSEYMSKSGLSYRHSLLDYQMKLIKAEQRSIKKMIQKLDDIGAERMDEKEYAIAVIISTQEEKLSAEEKAKLIIQML